MALVVVGIVSTNQAGSKTPTRRTFLGWWIAGLLTATVVSVLAPLGVYVFPPLRLNLRAGKIRVPLNTPLADIAEGSAVRFDSPEGMSFTMADGGEGNTAGDPTYGGYLTRDKGTLRAFAITCPHLGCSYNYMTMGCGTSCVRATARSSRSTEASCTDRRLRPCRISHGNPV